MVHSRFDRVVNLAFPTLEGPPRLLTVTGPDLPQLPDSLRIPREGLEAVKALPEGTPLAMTRDALEAPGLSIRWEGEAARLLPWQRPPLTPARARRFLALYESMAKDTGFDGLPEKRKVWAMDGLRDFACALLGEAFDRCSWPLGLGRGTTPAGDDAMVGVMAVLGSAGCPLTAELLNRTTDISARYLRCAQEGFFSAPLRRVWEAPSTASWEGLARVGATSGRDMLLGMAVGCRCYLNKEEKRMHVKEEIASRKLIAIVRGLPEEQLEGLAKALLAGGISLIEVTFNQAKPETWSQTAAGIAMLGKNFAGKIIPGAGTVVTQEQLTIAYEAGAQYIISPNTDVDIIRRTKELGLVSLPGAFSPSEIVTAYNAGADFVKVFPVGNLGPSYIKALKAPLSHIPLMAVGGVNEKNADDFMRAGASGLGVGGNLVNKEWIANGEWDKITALAAEFVKAVQG